MVKFLTTSVASANSPPVSVTRRVKLASEAPLYAATSAVTVPHASTPIPEIVTPLTRALAAPFTVTVSAL